MAKPNYAFDKRQKELAKKKKKEEKRLQKAAASENKNQDSHASIDIDDDVLTDGDASNT